MSKFETKKKLLVAESEVYRQLLKLELQTLKIAAKSSKRRLTSISTYLSMVMSGLPFLTGLFGQKKGKSSGSSWKRMSTLFLLGWKAYQRIGLFLGRKSFSAGQPAPVQTAAEEYLSRRL